MGQKVHPKIFRVGQMYSWNSKWFSKKNFGILLRQDLEIKKFILNELRDSGIVKIEIERTVNSVNVIIHTAKPGIIIGRGGKGVEDLKKKISRKFLQQKKSLNLNILEIKNPNLYSEIIVSSMIADLEKRIPYRRIMKQAISRVEKAGAKGIRVMVSGRLNGAEIARRETLNWGKLPLHTLRAEIDYARGFAKTTYGTIGVKVWIYKGEFFKVKENKETVKEIKK
ncbi:30S ribosomal protein S3 [Candidatus Parcubacteria bacterium]|nr:MAG: 30S ribosomal protein S3 [Candidatus Parcubacteria bacterium]